MTTAAPPVSYQYNPGDGSYGPGGYPGSITDCSGEITATFTWQPDPHLPSDPAPTAVIVVQTGKAYFGTSGATKGSAFCADGLGHAEQDTVMGTGQNAAWRGVSSGTVSTAQVAGAGGTVVVKCSPRSNRGTGGECSLNYSVQVYPITINLTGQNSANQTLTGQQITATLTGLPAGMKVTSYTWSFDGTPNPHPIKNWDGLGVAANGTPQQLFPLTATDLTKTDTSGSGISVNSLSFYDQYAESLSVKCAVSLKLPDGTTATVNAKSVPVAFLKPTASWTFTQLTVADDPANSSFQAGELLGPISITVPSPFSGGNGCLVQLVTTDRSVKRHPLNGKPDTYYYKVQKTNPDGTTSWVVPGQGLDGGFPYTQSITLDANNQPVVTNNSGGYIWGANDQGTPADTPTQSYTNTSLPTDNGGNDWYQSHASDSFVDYLMYKPPPFGTQGVIWVPLKTLTWSWNATATKDATGKWKSVGGMTTGQVTDATSPPQWSTVLQANEQYYP